MVGASGAGGSAGGSARAEGVVSNSCCNELKGWFQTVAVMS